MHYLTTGLAVIALLAIAVFSIQNSTAVEISFLAWSISLSKCLVIIGAYLLGMLSGWGFFGLFKKSLKK